MRTLVFSQTDSNTFNIVSEIKIIGNKTTKSQIILREIPIHIGDTIAATNLDKSIEEIKNNLLNTSLFNFVNVELVYFNNTYISIYITVEERWYWWPIPVFEVEENNFNTWWETKNFNRANYGLFLAKENFRGRKERLVFKLQKGYSDEAQIKYYKPYLNKNQTQGIYFGLNYKTNHEITYGTSNNIKDYYKNNTKIVQKEFNITIDYEFRPKLYNKHLLGLKFSAYNILDTVINLNADFLSKGATNLKYASFYYNLKRDKRNFKSYATKGYYFNLILEKNGLKMLNNSINSFSTVLTFNKYWQISLRNFLATGITFKTAYNLNEYHLLHGLGFRENLVRGYELYYINGSNYYFSKLQWRYALLPQKVFYLPSIKAQKFNKIPLNIYGGLFFDTGFVDGNQSNNNFLNNKNIYGYGVALDFVSYYDLVFRMEFSINHLHQKGLFLHFVAPF